MPKALRILSLCALAALVLLFIARCDTMSERETVTVQKRVPASALARDCTMASQRVLSKADTAKLPAPAPMSGGEWVCTAYNVTEVCWQDECVVTDVECAEWVYVEEDDPPGGGGGGPPYPPGDDECCETPPCEGLCYNPPGGGGDPVPPPTYDTTTTVVDSPCDMPNPPDYCDEAGSCFDKNISNPTHEAVLESMENEGALMETWNDSHPEATDQDLRKERNGFVTLDNGDYGFVRFEEVGNITATSCTIDGSVNIPANAVAVIHTHPYSDEERVTSEACLAKRYENPDQFLGPDAETIVTYESEPNAADRGMAEVYNMPAYVMDKDQIFVVDENGLVEDYNRCGY